MITDAPDTNRPVRFSIIDTEWLEVEESLQRMMVR
jgi:hypothetical protein